MGTRLEIKCLRGRTLVSVTLAIIIAVFFLHAQPTISSQAQELSEFIIQGRGLASLISCNVLFLLV